jgi:hypothetical protein
LPPLGNTGGTSPHFISSLFIIIIIMLSADADAATNIAQVKAKPGFITSPVIENTIGIVDRQGFVVAPCPNLQACNTGYAVWGRGIDLAV